MAELTLAQVELNPGDEDMLPIRQAAVAGLQRITLLTLFGYISGKLGFSQTVQNEVLGGTIDGNSTSFTLLNTPAIGSTALYLNGLRLTLGADYTVTGNNVTYTVAPNIGDVHICDYTH